MDTISMIGTAGVSLLLLAYFLQIRGVISNFGKFYIGMNFIGAGLACLSSVMLRFYPFVVLEGIWAVVSLMPLVKRVKN